jgi:hypothetical protein
MNVQRNALYFSTYVLHLKHYISAMFQMQNLCTKTLCVLLGKGKGKVKVRQRTGHEDPVGDYSFISLCARWGLVVIATYRPLYLRERPGTHCTGGWVGTKAGLDG